MPPLTLAHVMISLVGIVTGFVVIWGLIVNRPLPGWTALFLASTVGTSVSGFLFFPFERLLPSHVLGFISLVVLAAAIVSRYPLGLAGPSRRVYVITALAAQYLNFFVLIVQAFLKVPALHELAPKQTEPPFLVAQLAALALFSVLAVFSVLRFRGAAARPA